MAQARERREVVARVSRYTASAMAAGLIQDKLHGLSLGDWRYLAVVVLVVALFVALMTWQPVWDFFIRKGPALVQSGVSELWRSAHGSRSANDLQVVYGKIRNDRNGGGEAATAKDAEIWLEAFDVLGQRVGSAKGNWLDLSTGKPNDLDGVKALTLRPTRQEYGLEIAGKFLWGEDAWIAGEADPPTLKPGEYTMRASVSQAHGKAVEFEWTLENPGAGKRLHIDGLKSMDAARFAMLASVTNAETDLTFEEPLEKPTMKPFVIATEADAARAKITKWIRRGESIESGLTPLPSSEEISAQSDAWRKTQLQLIAHLTSAERTAIGQWQAGVVEELRMIGRGAIGLYSANEPLSYALLSALQDNRTFLRERMIELREVLTRLDGAESSTAESSTGDPKVLVAYTTQQDPNLNIRFLFPNEPDQNGPIMLSPGHGRTVRWHIELINNLPRDVPSVGFSILLPADLIHSLKAAGDLHYSVHEVPERMIRDGKKGSLCLSGSFGPLRGRGWTTAFTFDIGVHYAREIPVKVKIGSDESGNIEYCAPIIGVLEPIKGA